MEPRRAPKPRYNYYAICKGSVAIIKRNRGRLDKVRSKIFIPSSGLVRNVDSWGRPTKGTTLEETSYVGGEVVAVTTPYKLMRQVGIYVSENSCIKIPSKYMPSVRLLIAEYGESI